MKNILLVGLISLFTVFVPASLVALGVFLLIGSFLPFFLIASAVFILIGIIYNIIGEKGIKKVLKETKTNGAIEVPCAFCKTNHIVNILLDSRNTFVCTKCGHKSLIVLQFLTAQITTPLVVSETTTPIVEQD